MLRIVLVMALFFANLFADKMPKLVLSGPFASVSHPLARMIETNALSDVAEKLELIIWKSPDELRALTLSGGANFVALPTNVAANLHNKGVKIKLLNVSVWGILGLVSRDEKLKTLADFAGKELIVPFRGDMPDIVLTTLLDKQNLTDKIKLKYVATPIDAMQMMILRRADHSLLVEPAISMALIKTKSFPVKIIAPDIYRSVDLQKEWAKVFNTKPMIPQAGMASVGELDPKIIKRFTEEYDKALTWYKNNPKEAGVLTEKYFPMLKAPAVEKSIPNVNLQSIDAKTAKKDLEFFYKILLDKNPKLIGSKLPSEDFYESAF